MAASIANVSKLSSRIIRVLGCNPSSFTLQGTNTYIIGTGYRRILLDTGEPNVSQYISNLEAVLSENHITLEHIILTHWHKDHIGGVSGVIKLALPDCKVWKHERSEDEKSLDRKNFLGIFDPDKICKLYNGQIFKTEGATLRVVHTPGHTTDHIVLHLEEDNAVFSGDCILGEGTTVFEDLLDFIESLKLIQRMAPTVIYPGHGPVIQDPNKVINYYLEHRMQRENEIIEFLKQSFNKPLTSKEVTTLIYKDHPLVVIEHAQVIVEQHLKKLLKEGKVSESEGGWILHLKNNI